MKPRDIALVGCFAALMSAAALFSRFGGEAVVPFSIMPLVIMLTGALLGPRLAFLSVLVYILLGLVGVPVFARPPFGGPAYVASPTFGFLLSYLAAAPIIGWLVERASRNGSGFVAYLGAMLAGVVAIYAIGLPYLYLVLRAAAPVSFASLVFVPSKGGLSLAVLFALDLVKAAVAALIARPSRQRLASAGLLKASYQV